MTLTVDAKYALIMDGGAAVAQGLRHPRLQGAAEFLSHAFISALCPPSL